MTNIAHIVKRIARIVGMTVMFYLVLYVGFCLAFFSEIKRSKQHETITIRIVLPLYCHADMGIYNGSDYTLDNSGSCIWRNGKGLILYNENMV